MAKFYNIDPETCSLDELKAAMEECKNKEDYYNALQLGAKLFINSVYGVFGTDFFNLCNKQLAESITLQGQDLIKYSVNCINDYFANHWKDDVETHKKISVYMKEKYPDFDAENFEKTSNSIPLSFTTLQEYGDTDSAYITLQPIISLCSIPIEQQIDFCLAVYDCFLEEYLNDCFEAYAKKFNCDKNLEKFELEKISRTIIMLVKKNYMCDVAWVDTPAHLAPLSHVTYTGYDVVKGSTPEFCRQQMKEFAEFILDCYNKGQKPDYDTIVRKMKAIKVKFSIQSPNDISKATNLSDYEVYVKDDKTNFGKIEYYDENNTIKKDNGVLVDAVNIGKEVKTIVPIHVRASSVYNNMLYTKYKKYKTKYAFIHKGDKVKFYYTSPDEVFAFIPNQFPMEFAPKMDIETQFEKMLLSPLNRIVAAIGYPEVSASLTYSPSLW